MASTKCGKSQARQALKLPNVEKRHDTKEARSDRGKNQEVSRTEKSNLKTLVTRNGEKKAKSEKRKWEGSNEIHQFKIGAAAIDLG